MGIVEMMDALRTMGVSDGVIRKVQTAVREEREAAPVIGSGVLAHLRQVISQNKGAFLKLSSSGKYRVFTSEGHAALTASCLKHKPWKAAMASRVKN